MAFVPNDATTIKHNQLRRYEQAERDLRQHQRRKSGEILLLLAAVLGACGGGLFLFHLLP